jgi:hypothetical protein
MTTKAKSAPPPAFEWLSLPEDRYAAELGRAVHFSFKVVNSNGRAGGVRITEEQALDAPYVSARTLIATHHVPFDYPEMDTRTVKVWSNLRALEQGIDLSDVPQNELADFKSALRSAEQTYLLDAPADKMVEIRLRQVSVPIDDQYISVTPLPCGGLNVLASRVLQSRMPAIETAREAGRAKTESQLPYRLIKPRYVVFGIGGSNTQNVGRLIKGYMNRPFYCPGPQRDSSLYEAISKYRSGIDVKVPYGDLCRYRTFRASLRRRRGAVESTMDLRTEEKAIVGRMVDSFMTSVRADVRLVAQHRDAIHRKFGVYQPAESDAVVRGFYDAAFRDMTWVRAVSERLSKSVIAAKMRLRVDGKVQEVSMLLLDESARRTLQGWMEEACMRYAVAGKGVDHE